MMTNKTGTLPLPTEPSARNSLTAVLTVAGIGTITRETKGIVDEPEWPQPSVDLELNSLLNTNSAPIFQECSICCLSS